jgi:hypothetical protein
MRYNLLIVSLCLLLFGGSAFAQAPKKEPAKKDGWWLKVNPEGTQMIGFYVGATSNSYGFWTVWNPGDPVEFDISNEYRNSPTLYVLAQTATGAKCRFCVMNKSKGAQHFEFDLEEDHEIKQTDEDKRCK